MTYILYGQVAFNNNTQRNRARDTVVQQATARGFTAAPYTLRGVAFTGTWTGVVAGAATLRFAYTGTQVEAAFDEIYRYMDGNGMLDDSFAGMAWVS